MTLPSERPRPARVPGRMLEATVHDGTRIVVRQWRSTDLATYHRAMLESVEHLAPWMPWAMAEPQTPDAHELILNRFADRWAFDDFVYGIFLGDRAVGGTGLHNRVGPDGWEIGYWVHPDFEGRGIVSAVVRALTDEAFTDPGVDRVEIRCDAANARSAAVPVRLGFELVGVEDRVAVAPFETTVGHVYRMTRRRWSV